MTVEPKVAKKWGAVEWVTAAFVAVILAVAVFGVAAVVHRVQQQGKCEQAGGIQYRSICLNHDAVIDVP